MHGHLLVGRIQIGVVAPGFGHAGLGVVRHHQFWHAVIELEGPHVSAYPTCQLLVGSGFGVGVGTGSEHGNEQMRLLHRATTRIINRNRCSCPIHEQFLAGLVLLPQHHILFPAATAGTARRSGCIGNLPGLPAGTLPKATVA